MRCSVCATDNPDGMKFCGECGAPLPRACPVCGFANPPGFKFCGNCGSPLTPATPTLPVSASTLASSASPPRPPAAASTAVDAVSDAERRQLTVMFCDLVGSTALSERLDPEDLRAVMSAYIDACERVIRRFDGHIAKYLGDGLLVYFGHPQAHEDDAQRAIRAGLGIVAAVANLRSPVLADAVGVLAVRVGIHTGLVVVGEIGAGQTREASAIVGESANLAARLQGLAEPNTVVLSAATYHLVEGYFECRPLDPQTVKGISQPIQVYQALRESGARTRLDVASGRGLTRLVGRQQELGLLLDRWDKARDGEGQVVLLTGEAGIGKSRLAQAVSEHVAVDPDSALIPLQCSPYFETSPLYPVIDLLQRDVLQFDEAITPDQKVVRLEGWLTQNGLPLADAAPLLISLLSIPAGDRYPPLDVSPARQRQRTLQTLLSVLLTMSERQPVLVAVEDLHWADPSTLDLLRLLVDQTPTHRILVLGTARPEFEPPWADRAYVSQVVVNRLSRSQAAEIAAETSHGKPLPPEVLDQIVAKTDGVPLFIEELTRMLLESGLLRERGGGYEITGPLPPLAIPSTLQDSLMARLDRLAPIKELAQLAACLGREFRYDLLRAVSPLSEAVLQEGLRQLVDADLLRQRGVPPNATYLFKHALIQDTAYQSLLKSRRQQLHQRIAQTLVERFPDVAEEQPEIVAQHYAAAGLVDPAIDYWTRAGQRALSRSADVEAASHFQQALGLLLTLPESPARMRREMDIQIRLSAAQMVVGGFAGDAAEAALVRALDLGRALGDPPEILPVLGRLSHARIASANLTSARELSDELMALAQRTQHDEALLEAYTMAAICDFFTGRFQSGRANIDAALARYDTQRHRDMTEVYGLDPGVHAGVYAFLILWCQGYLSQAARCREATLDLARRLTHGNSLAFALGYASLLEAGLRDATQTLAVADEAIAVALRHQAVTALALARAGRSWALGRLGHVDEALAELGQAISDTQSSNTLALYPHVLTGTAEAYLLAGQVDEALIMLESALGIIELTGERWSEAETHRVRGEALLAAGQPWEVATESYARALEVAHHQEAHTFALRTALSQYQAGLRHAPIEAQSAARGTLTEAYNWFTEGFDMPDLVAARAALDAPPVS